MKEFKYVIVGGGIVAGYAAKEFIKHSNFKAGDLAIITNDDAIPYERPPLSKDFLAGEEEYSDIQINEPKFYRDHGIRLFLYTTVNNIDTTTKSVHTDHGDVFGYDKLLLATGSRANVLKVPGGNNSLIQYLRTLDDAKSIRSKLDKHNKVIVIGGGYIGMETAASLTQDGHQVTMVFPEKRLLQSLFSPELSDFFEDYYRQQGIEIIKGATVDSFQDIPTRRIRACLSDGQVLDGDLVVAGIGASPNVDFLRKTRIEVGDGVIVNQRLQTSVNDVYAAGDIANYFDATFHKRRRIEHWQNAVDMGQYVAREMLAIPQDNFQSLRYFFSDVFDLSYEFWGDKDGADRVVYIADDDKASIGVWWLKNSRVIATFLMNRPDEERIKAQKWILQKQLINPDMLESAVKVLS